MKKRESRKEKIARLKAEMEKAVAQHWLKTGKPRTVANLQRRLGRLGIKTEYTYEIAFTEPRETELQLRPGDTKFLREVGISIEQE
jgi:hypothetical protein